MARLRWQIVLFSLVIIHPISVYPSKTIDTNQNLARCLQNMIRIDNATPIKYILISTETDSKLEKWKFGEITNQLLASNDLAVTFEIDNKNPAKTNEFPIHRRILFVDSFESFKRIIHFQRSYKNDVSGNFQYFYVILPNTVDNLDYVLKQFTTFCLENMIADVNILVGSTKGGVKIYSYYPFTPTNCRNSKPHIHNYYKNGNFKWIKPVFPPKLSNLWNCSLTVIVWDESPFILNANKPDRRSGVDIEYLKFFQSNLNVTWNIKKISSGPGEIYSNGTITKGFKMLHDRHTDLMACGSAINSKRMSNFATSRFYFGSSLRLILKPPEKYGPLSVLLFPFDNFTWLTIFLVILVKWVLQTVLKRTSEKLHFSKRLSLKVLMPVWLLSFLIFRSSYEGSLYKFLHDNPLKKIPQNLEEAVKDGYIFIAPHGFYNVYGHVFFGIDKSRIKVINAGFEECHKYFSKLDGKYALLSTGDYLAGYRSQKSPLREEYQSWMLTDTMLNYNTAMYMPKFSFLTPVLNKQIGYMFSTGLSNKAYEDIVMDEMNRRKFVAGRNLPVKMSPEHFFGAFQILAGMIVVGWFVFLIEIISERNRIVKKLFKILYCI